MQATKGLTIGTRVTVIDPTIDEEVSVKVVAIASTRSGKIVRATLPNGGDIYFHTWEIIS